MLRLGMIGRETGEMTRDSFQENFWRSVVVIEDAPNTLGSGVPDISSFKLIAEYIPTLCWIANGDGYIVWYNKRWHDYCGTQPEEMEGWGWQRVHDPDRLPAVMELWTQSISNGTPFEMTFPLMGADGVYRPFLTRIQPLRDSNGQVVRWIGVNTEISAQVAAEYALRDLTLTLEERIQVASRDREEALTLLHEAQKVETLGQLTGGVAHDFNNLLTPIMGGIDMLSRKLAHDDRAQRIAAGAMQSAERAKTLVQRLLSFGRRQTLQSRALDVAELVEGMRDLIERSLGPSVDIVVDILADLPAVEADPNQLELAILNLCVNARDAMEGGGRLTIAAHSVERANGAAEPECVALRVTDTGKGMDQATLARATEPFFTTKGIGQGTGLGLSMVYGLAAQSGGKFILTSTVGMGTTAELVLPVATTPAERQSISEPQAIEPGVGTILLVDDEELVRISVADGLRELGYKVVEAASASGALEHLREGLLPDVLVTDHMMPGMTGTTLAQEARKRLPALPVLMITGYANLRPEETRALEVIAKPFHRGDLAIRVASLIENAAQGRVVQFHGRSQT